MERRPKLKPRRAKFAEEYIKDYDGTASAIRAGYSEHSARFIASRLLINPEVSKEIERLKEAEKKRYEIRREKILEKIDKLVKSCFDSEGEIKDKKHLVKALDMLNKMSGNYSHTVINQTPDQPLFPDK